ncbi:MAG: hypothetical protein JWN66_3096 [Sphingomonas bacterium]|uniref:hypothetical protein n=1 Tax=Sphingomonas bacterium TaxID=1895847 RepID=UPI00260AB4AF|nr:hypothetical protein [Sphingomonas bacterium]MDB5705980.1 hypothetical protein [Sphingomonas bacterium]
MSRDDRAYYQGRAEAELKRAEASNDPAAVRLHYQLAELHLERVGQCPPCDEDTAHDLAGTAAPR